MYRIVIALTFLLNALPAQGNDQPSYKDGVLTIPSINTDDQVGMYQNAAMEMNPDGSWRLASVRAMHGQGGLPFAYLTPIRNVEAVKTDGVPVQVLLRVSGQFPSSCGSVGQVSQRRVGNRFEVVIADAFTRYDEDIACAAVIQPYVRVVPLAVYGLSAGTYSYVVNGVQSGTFVLGADNVLSGN